MMTAGEGKDQNHGEIPTSGYEIHGRIKAGVTPIKT
jgi:hypothetical protein